MAGTASGQNLIAKPRSASACFLSQRISNEPLKVVSLRTAIDATIHQDAEFGRRLVALVEQLIETVKRQFNGDFHWPEG